MSPSKTSAHTHPRTSKPHRRQSSAGRGTPVPTSLKDEESPADESEGDWPFRMILGYLPWHITNQTRADISNAVRPVARWDADAAKEVRKTAAIDVLEYISYVKSTRDNGFHFRGGVQVTTLSWERSLAPTLLATVCHRQNPKRRYCVLSESRSLIFDVSASLSLPNREPGIPREFC